LVKRTYDRLGLGIDLLSKPDDHFTELGLADNLAFRLGQLYIAPCAYPPSKLFYMETCQPDPQDELNTTYLLRERERKLTLTDIQRIASFPLRVFDLRTDEELMVSKFKYRRAVVLNIEDKIWEHQIPGLLDPKKKEKVAICLPLCSTKDYQDDTGFVVDVQAFKFQQFFYIPPCSKFDQEEAIARFDLIQPININHLVPHKSVLNNRPVMLSEVFRDYLLHWLNRFYTGMGISEEYDKDISTIRALIEEATTVGTPGAKTANNSPA
jgi:hypothetical protein